MQVPFARMSYQARSLPVSAQRLVNFFAEKQPDDAKTPIALYNTPGIKSFTTAGTGPCRGLYEFGGLVYAVMSDTLFSIASDGTAVSIGALADRGQRVSFSDNGTEIIIVDGVQGWTYDTTNGLRLIDDADFYSADFAMFIDGFFALNRAGTGQYFISNLNDGRSYLGTDIATAEGAPDNIVSIVASHRELWVFGERTTEIWFNTGASGFPFERIQGAFIQRGCGAKFSVVQESDTLFWFGDDRIAYIANGYQPQRISTHAIESAWQGYATVDDAFGFIYTNDGHKFWCLTFPTANATWVFDTTTGLWHERESHDIGRWRVNAYVNAFGKHLVGDYSSNAIGEMDPDTFQEYGNDLVASAASPVMHADRKQLFHHGFEIDFESGVGTNDDPVMWLDYSDDGGRTFSARKPSRGMGNAGKFKTRARWLRLGRSRNRVYRVTISDGVKRTLIAAHLNASAGDH